MVGGIASMARDKHVTVTQTCNTHVLQSLGLYTRPENSATLMCQLIPQVYSS